MNVNQLISILETLDDEQKMFQVVFGETGMDVEVTVVTHKYLKNLGLGYVILVQPEDQAKPMTIDELVDTLPKEAAIPLDQANYQTYDRLERDNAILQMAIDGLSTREIATLKKLSYQTVYGVIRKAKKGK